jgi:pilus assembly protein TadC
MMALVPVLLAVAVLAWPPRVHRPSVAGAATPHGTHEPATLPVVANAVDLLALALRGGAGLTEAIEAVAARMGGAVGHQLRTVAAALRWGVDDAAAWSGVPQAWQPAARALRMASRVGVAPADLLQSAAEDMRRAEQQRLEVAAARLGVHVVLPLGLAFLPAFALTTVVPVVLALTHQVLGQ